MTKRWRLPAAPLATGLPYGTPIPLERAEAETIK
jgi:hypothetical protein